MKKAIYSLWLLMAFNYLYGANYKDMTNIQEEIWKDVPGYEGLYQVSNIGRVKSLSRLVDSPIRNNPKIRRKDRILKQATSKLLYKRVVLQIVPHKKCFSVHRLVAIAFIPNPSNWPIINHIDCDPSNNRVENLEWCTQSHNIKHAFNLGRKKAPAWFYNRNYGKDHPASKRVVQRSLSGDFLRTWDCLTDIQRELGFDRPNICKACRGKISMAYGFKWEYV